MSFFCSEKKKKTWR